jgi:hypothetical protein
VNVALAGAASVEVITRSRIRWFADREPSTRRGPVAQRVHRIAYPAVGYGPPIVNRLALSPGLLERAPKWFRRAVTRRALRSGGSPWIGERFHGRVFATENADVTGVEIRGDEVTLTLSDGTERHCDDVLLATGYRFSLDRLTFLERELAQTIRVEENWPLLDARFRSTNPRVIFVGYPAEGRFGPTARFVLGTRFTCERVLPAAR